MPTLKQLTCHIEWASSKVPFKEYGISYGDGSVDCYVPIPSTSTPFSIHLASNGFISSGLAMFVFMDGIYQCNRNKNDLVYSGKKPGESSVPKARDVSFRVRQKEEKLPDGKWVGKPWRFEPLRIISDIPQIDPANFRDLGSIVVVVLRCQSRDGRHEAVSDGSRTPESAMAFGPLLDGSVMSLFIPASFFSRVADSYVDAASTSSDEFFVQKNPPSPEMQECASFGDWGSLFDGGNDYEYSYGYDYSYANDISSNRRPRCGCRRCAKLHDDEVENQQYAARRRFTAAEPWDAYNPVSSPEPDRIRRNYGDLPAYAKTRSVPQERRNRYPRYERRHNNHDYRPDSPPLRSDPEVRNEAPKREVQPSSDDNKGCENEPQPVPHRCVPSIVLNVNPGPTIQEGCDRIIFDQDQGHCAHGKSRRLVSGGCYTISNGKRIPSHCCCSHSQHTCSKRECASGVDEPPNDNDDTRDNSQEQAQNWNTDNGNQNSWGQVNGDSGAHENTQVNENNTNAWATNTQENHDQPAAWDSSNPAPDTNNVVDMTQGTNWQTQPEDNYNNDNQQESNWNSAPNDTTNNDDNNGYSRPWGENTQAWQENTGWNNNNYNNGNQQDNPNYEQTTGNQQVQPQTQPSSAIPEFVLPALPEDSTGEPPLYTVPEGIAKAKSLSHQVQVGRPADYSHRVRVPEYLDSMEAPYAKFTFNYRLKESIESKFNVTVERDVEAERKILKSLPRDQIVDQLLRARGLLGEQNTGNGYVVPNITTEPVLTSEPPPPPPSFQNGNVNGNAFASTTAHVDNTTTNTNHVHWGDKPAPNDHNANNTKANNGEPFTITSRFNNDYSNNNHEPNWGWNDQNNNSNNNENTQNNTGDWQRVDHSGNNNTYTNAAGTTNGNGDSNNPAQWNNNDNGGNGFNAAGNDQYGNW